MQVREAHAAYGMSNHGAFRVRKLDCVQAEDALCNQVDRSLPPFSG